MASLNDSGEPVGRRGHQAGSPCLCPRSSNIPGPTNTEAERQDLQGSCVFQPRRGDWTASSCQPRKALVESPRLADPRTLPIPARGAKHDNGRQPWRAPGETVIVVGAGLPDWLQRGAALHGRSVTVFDAADLVGGAAAYSGGRSGSGLIMSPSGKALRIISTRPSATFGLLPQPAGASRRSGHAPLVADFSGCDEVLGKSGRDQVDGSSWPGGPP